jgi:pimeloyl-ACP methyl ester carboxylesterase
MVALARLDTTVRVLEVGHGPPVVFVHGASNGATSWAHLVARMPEFRCVLLDRPGCGLSPPLRVPAADVGRLGEVADALVVDVLEALELSRADVVATSFGGYFGLRGAAAHPDRVRRLTLLGWTFGAPVTATPLVMRVATTPVMGRLATRIPATDATVRLLLRQVGLRGALASGRFGPNEIAWFKALLNHTNTMRNEIAGSPRVMTMRGFNEASLLPADVLQRLTAPVLALWGSDDPMGGVRIAEVFCSLLPDARLEILDGAGHAPWIDDPDGVAGRLSEFLATDEPQTQ